MIALVLGGILRAATRIASTFSPWTRAAAVFSFLIVFTQVEVSPLEGQTSWASRESSRAVKESSRAAWASSPNPTGTDPDRADLAPLSGTRWDFGRRDDPQFLGLPAGWKRYEGVGYPQYVKIGIKAKDTSLERELIQLDTALIKLWERLNDLAPSVSLPLPPSIADLIIDRYLRVDLDGGQALYESPAISCERSFQYHFRCHIMTERLRHDSARAQLVFLGDQGRELAIHSTTPLRGTNDWTPLSIDPVRPPVGATSMLVRLRVDRGEDGLEDIRGAAGFDQLQIQPYPQLQITTDKPLGIYKLDQRIEARVDLLGLPPAASRIELQLYDFDEREIAKKQLSVSTSSTESLTPKAGSSLDAVVDSSAPASADESAFGRAGAVWRLPRLQPGFYRLSASITGRSESALSSETTFAVIDASLGGPTRGSFGWALPDGNDRIPQSELAQWLVDAGVGWVKYPCWISPQDTEAAETTASLLNKLEDVGIRTVGMLDHPPDDQLANYEHHGHRDLVAAQLFRDVETWQPLLEPVMSRLTLRVHRWQLGADRDFSFLGQPRLRKSVEQISKGLQGFGQPIDVAISWPWLERQLPASETSWQAVSRSSDPPLSVSELDAYLTLNDQRSPANHPRTWLIIDPITKGVYDRENRIRDLVLRMATVRSHRVQAAFISDPRDPDRGLLRRDGRPGELMLPWRTTSKLIGDLEPEGKLPLLCGAKCVVFADGDRAVLLLWSPHPTEELIYLGDQARRVDVWGNASRLEREISGNQVTQRVTIGPTPTFIIDVDRELLAFRMSINVEPAQLDSILGQEQQLEVSFWNPTQESVVGRLRVEPPTTWSVDSNDHGWELLPGRTAFHTIRVVLGNTSKIGKHELPIQLHVDGQPPRVITVYKPVSVGPVGLELDVTTRLLESGDLRVQLEMTNRTVESQSYDCILFPAAHRQYQRCFLEVPAGQTVRRTVHWRDGEELAGKKMLLRADEQDGPRVFNHSFETTR